MRMPMVSAAKAGPVVSRIIAERKIERTVHSIWLDRPEPFRTCSKGAAPRSGARAETRGWVLAVLDALPASCKTRPRHSVRLAISELRRVSGLRNGRGQGGRRDDAVRIAIG